MSTPDETARLATSAQRAASAAAASVATGLAAPSAAVRAVRALELAVHAEVRDRIRQAREDGDSWAAVGEFLGFGPIATGGPGTLAELAFAYAAGPLTVDPAFPVPPSFRWDCAACGRTIADYGPVDGPAADQDCHADGCERLAADVKDWEQEAPR